MPWNLQPDLENIESNLGETMFYQYWEEAELTGYPVKFLKAVEVSNNKIFQESTARSFINTNGFDMKSKRDEDNLYSGTEVFGNFGYTPSYNQIIYVPIKYFTDMSQEPVIGDLFYDKTDEILFEITKIDSLTESQSSIRINNKLFSYKIYLKHYQWSYNDKFDSNLETELIDDELDLQQLDQLNKDLTDEIDGLNILDENETDDVFGEFR